MFPNPKYDLIKRTQRFQTIGLLNPLSRRTGLTKRLQFCEDPKYGLFACIWVRPQSVRPCYLWSDHDFCMHFQHCIFRLVSAKFRQFLGCNRRPYHGLSRSVTAFSDNAQDLSIVVFCLLSRSVTICHATVRQFEANMNRFPIKYNLRLSHFDNVRALCDHQK